MSCLRLADKCEEYQRRTTSAELVLKEITKVVFVAGEPYYLTTQIVINQKPVDKVISVLQ